MEINLDFEQLVKELDKEEKEELFGRIDEETGLIKEYLNRFNPVSLNALAMLLIDPDMDGTFTVSEKYKKMDPVELIVTYYKCNTLFSKI